MVNQYRFPIPILILFGMLVIFGCGEEKITEPEAEFQLAPFHAAFSSEFIPPDGGELELNDGSRLKIPRSALGDAGKALDLSNKAKKILADGEVYVSKLRAKGKHPRKWIIEGEKGEVLDRIKEANEEIDGAIGEIKTKKFQPAIEKIKEALEKLGEVDDYIDGLIAGEEIAGKTVDDIKDYNEAARERLESAISRPYCLLGTEITVNRVPNDKYLTYEFGTNGLIFNYGVPFEVPFYLLGGDGVNISKKTKLFIFYSQDGKKEKKIKIDYDIDLDRNVVTFYIPHFTYYSFWWRR